MCPRFVSLRVAYKAGKSVPAHRTQIILTNKLQKRRHTCLVYFISWCIICIGYPPPFHTSDNIPKVKIGSKFASSHFIFCPITTLIHICIIKLGAQDRRNCYWHTYIVVQNFTQCILDANIRLNKD